jgi:hypothetical protein
MKQMFTMAFIVCLMQRVKSIHTTPTHLVDKGLKSTH